MSINKRKILQSAQKHLQKGALDKALKDYQTLLKADPRDVNVRLKIGDIHLKQGNTGDAVAAYVKVADRFMQDGFDAKAVALYKQITKIDAKRTDVYEPLAELYQRLGLTSDAMAALQTAADAHYRDGNRDEALDLLRKMAALDPSNTTSRLKVADLLRQEGRGDEAVAEFEAVAEELERQGDAEGRLRALEKVLEVDPKRQATLEEVARLHLAGGRGAPAEQAARALLEHHGDTVEGHELLASALEAAGRQEESVAAWRKCAELYKERGDDARSRDIMQRFVAAGSLGAEGEERVLEDDSADLVIDDAPIRDLGSDQEALSDPGYLSDDGLRLGNPIDGLRAEDAAEEGDGASGSSLPPLPRLDAQEGGAGGDAGDGDPEQLLAEASVYLRYGKHDRAVESLRGLLARHPQHRGALEKLGEALAATGDAGDAVEAFARAARRALADADRGAFDALCERVDALDGDAARALREEAGPAASPPDADAARDGDAEIEEELLDEIDIEIDPGLDETPVPVPAPEVSSGDDLEFALDEDDDATPQAGDDDLSFDLEDDSGPPAPGETTQVEMELGGLEEAAISHPPGAAEDEDEALPGAFDAEEEFLADEEPTAEPVDVPVEPEAGPEASQSSATTPQQLVDDLEEADFYYQQGMLDEARTIYERVVAVAPNHPQAMLRLGEIDAAGSGRAAGPAAEAVLPEPSTDEAAEPDLTFDLDDDGEDDALLGEGDASWEPAPDDAGTVDTAEEGLDLGAELDLDEAEDVEASPEAVATPSGPGLPEVTGPLREEEPVDDAEASADGGDFDLAAELSGALDEEEPSREGPGGTTEEEGFEQVFAAFKAGVQRQLGDADHQAHYDLGIAYKEMGLLDDAIDEFRKAMTGPQRQLSCLHMMGLCALDLARVTDAVAHIEQALALPDVPAEQQVALRFDLGRAYVEQGDLPRARAAFEAVVAVEPDFADAADRLAALERGELAPPASDDTADEAFESFDDLIGGDEPEDAEAAAPEAPAYESFSELVEAEPAAEDVGELEPVTAEPIEAEPLEAEAVEPEPVTAEPAAADPEAPPEGGGGKGRGARRRKKISFV